MALDEASRSTPRLAYPRHPLSFDFPLGSDPMSSNTENAETRLLPSSEIEKIKERCERATHGPWKSYVEGRDHTSGSDFIMTAGADIYLQGASVADQDFIAHARQYIPALIAEIERLGKLTLNK